MRSDPTFSWLTVSPLFFHIQNQSNTYTIIKQSLCLSKLLFKKRPFFLLCLFLLVLSKLKTIFFLSGRLSRAHWAVYYTRNLREASQRDQNFETCIERGMAISRVSFEVVAVIAALMFAIFLPATNAQGSGPAPAPTSDG